MRTLFAIVPAIISLSACTEKSAPPPPPVQAAARAPGAALLTPDAALVAAVGPDSFVVRVTSSHGPFDIKVHRDWAPRGSDRLFYLVSNGFYDGVRFFRVLDGFVAQFGAHGDPGVAGVWSSRAIADDPVTHGNKRGTLTFATSGPNSRTTQLFINFSDNTSLDAMGFAVLGEVVQGMTAVDGLYKGYGEGAPGGNGPDQGRIGREGNAYLTKDFPKLDFVITATIADEWKKK